MSDGLRVDDSVPDGRDKELLQLFLDHLDDAKTGETPRHRKSHLEQFKKWLIAKDYPQFEDIEHGQIERHFRNIMNTHAEVYSTARVSAISVFYKWLSDDDNTWEFEDAGVEPPSLSENPASGVLSDFELTHRTRKSQVYQNDIIALTRDEAKKLVHRENIPKPKTRNEIVVKLLLQTGVRAKELQRIRIGDMIRPSEADNDEQRREIRVRSVKNKPPRTVYYQPSLDNALSRWLDGGLRDVHAPAEDSDRLFVTNRSEKISYTVIRDVVDEAARNAGIQDKMYEDASGNPRWKVTPHTLRHTMARFAVTGEKPEDVAKLARWMGHFDKQGNPNTETTKKYLSFRDTDMYEMSRTSLPNI